MLTLVLIASLLVLVALAAAAKARPRPQHSAGYLMAAQLNVKLAGTAMRGTGFRLVVEGKRRNVHPAFIAAVAGLESSYGARVCEPFNGWGLGSCGRAWHPPAFGSWRESIAFFARWFRQRYGPGQDVWSVGRSYCPPCGSGWGAAVSLRMRLLGFSTTTRYPA